MRQHHPVSLPFYSVCINGANRNYQTLHYSLKPFCGNCHLTTLQQGSERLLQASRALLEAPCAKHRCGVCAAGSAPWHANVPLCGGCAAAMRDGNTHTTAYQGDLKPKVPWTRPYNNTHTTHSRCCPCTLSARAPWALSDPRQRAIKSFWSIH